MNALLTQNSPLGKKVIAARVRRRKISANADRHRRNYFLSRRVASAQSLYLYVRANPLRWIDPTGLIEWNGTATAGAAIGLVGMSGVVFNLTSRCVNGKRGVVTAIGIGPAVGLGATLSGTRGNVTFEDNLSDVNPYIFNGGFRMAAIGYAWGPHNPNPWASPGARGGGYGAAAISCGGAISIGHGPMYGLDASVSGVGGSCTVLEAKIEDCDECKK